MFRSFALFCCAALFSFSVIFAQDAPPKPEPVKTTPEMLALFDESFQTLSQAEPTLRVNGLFQLLGFAVNFEDKTPAQKVVDTLLALAATIETEELRNQLYEGVATALCDQEKYAEAVGVVNRITPAATKFEPQLNLAIALVRNHEQDKSLPPFDASELLRHAAAGAAEAKNISLEAAARIFLGRELARQGKQNESITAFAEAMNSIQKVEDVNERNDMIGLHFQSQVLYNQMDKVLATLQTITDDQQKRWCFGILIQHEKFDEAEALLKSLPAGELKDSAGFEYAVASIKTITDEKIGTLAAVIGADDQREQFLQRMIVELLKNDRNDVADQVGKRLKDTANTNLVMLLGKVESFAAKKQFAEAIDFIDNSKEEETLRQQIKRQILVTQYRETHEEKVAAQIAETYSASERMTLAELNESAKQAAAMTDSAAQIEVFLEVLQQQFQLMDLTNARQTMKLVSEQLDKDTNVVRIIRYRLLLARLQSEMREKQGAKEGLTKLMQTLSAVKDLKTLKDLLPEQPQTSEAASGVANDGKIKLDLPRVGGEPPVDESAIKDQLFQIYLLTANLLSKSDAPAESKAAFAKAKELANTAPTTADKASKLLLLSQMLAAEGLEQDR